MINVDAYVFRRLLVGHTLNGELDSLSPEWRPLGDVMNPLAAPDRKTAWEGALSLRGDSPEIRKAVIAADPLGPMPPTSFEPFATAADVRRLVSTSRWLWSLWIPDSSIFGVAAYERTGKTRFLLDLARRIWLKLDYPDGQSATFPEKTPTLWICADGHQAEIMESLPDMGLPDEAIIFTGPRSDPYANVELDDPETFEAIDRAITIHKPGLVFVDTLTTATTRDLCDQRTIAALKAPLLELCQRHRTTIGLSLHLSREGQALGRRVKSITRALLHLECPDPAHSDRLKLWVEKSYDRKPRAMGVTIKGDGNAYDFNPPVKPDPPKGGRPPEKLDKAIAFLEAELSGGDQKGCELISRWEGLGENKGTLFNAKQKMADEGRLVVDDSRKPQIWHLVTQPAP
jgi:hypothetical protein